MNLQTTWDLSSLFENDFDPKIDIEKERLLAEADKFVAKWESRTDWLENPEKLAQILTDYQDWLTNWGFYGKVGYYFFLRTSQDSIDPILKAKANQIEEVTIKIANQMQFVELRISGIDQTKQQEFLQSEKLIQFRHFLEKIFENSKYLLSEKEEKIVNLLSFHKGKWSEMVEEFLSSESVEMETEPKIQFKTQLESAISDLTEKNPAELSKVEIKVLLIDAVDCLIFKNSQKELALNGELFEVLQARKERKIVVTNAKGETLKKIKKLLNKPGFEIFTLEFEPDKTKPQYFEILLKTLKLKAENCFYFDHLVENLESAKKSGIEGILYQNNPQIIGVLNYGLDNLIKFRPKLENLNKAYIVEKSLPADKFLELSKYGNVSVDKISEDWGKLVWVYFTSQDEQHLLDFLTQNLLIKSQDNSAWYCEVGSKVVFANKIIDVATDEGFAEFQNYGRKLKIPEEQLDALNARSFDKQISTDTINSKPKTQTLTFEELMTKMSDPDQATRDLAAVKFNQVLEKYKKVAEHELNAILQHKKVIDELRGYQSPDSARLCSDDVDPKTVKTLLESVQSKFEISHKYYELKAKLMGKEKLQYHERNVEYGKIVQTYTFEQGVEILQRVFKKLDNSGQNLEKNLSQNLKNSHLENWQIQNSVKKNIIFDFWGVLFFEDTDKFAEEISNKITDGKQKLPKIKSMMKELIKLARKEESVENWVKEFEEFTGQKAHSKSVWGDNFLLNSKLVDFIENNKQNYNFYFLTNIDKDIFEKCQKAEFLRNFQGGVASCDVNARKPNSEIYRILLEKYNLKVEECIFVDDKLENIQTAQNLGMQTILFDENADNLEEKINELENKTKPNPENSKVQKVELAQTNHLINSFSSILEDYLQNGKIDVYPRTGKRGGAFMTGNTGRIIDPTFIFLNWTNTLNDVQTFAHEMGHACNFEMMKKTNKALTWEGSHLTVESPSTFMEDFILEDVLENCTNKEEKLAILMKKLNDDTSSIFRQISLYLFELELHSEFRAKGYLSTDQIGELFSKHMANYMGNAVEKSVGSGNWWIYWSHIRYMFYVYSYAAGLLISKSMQKRLKENPDFIKNIKQFYASGMDKTPIETLQETLQIEATKPEIWLEGLEQTAKTLEMAQTLAMELGLVKFL